MPITPNRMRGQVSAVYLFWLNLAAIEAGSTIVALVTQNPYDSDLGISGRSQPSREPPLRALTLCLAPCRLAMDRARIIA